MHLAPAFGADDLDTGRRTGCRWSTRSGRTAGSPGTCRWSAGCSSRTPTEPLIARPGRPRAAVPRREPYEHSYPHCWRCGTPLLYYALPSWYIRTTAIKDQLLAENERTTLAAADDQATAGTASGCATTSTGRCRGPGTGARRCRCGSAATGHLTCVGSLAELVRLAGRDLSGLDPHRPFVDEVTIACPSCGGRGAPGARGDRRLVRLRVDAVRPVRRAAGGTRTSSSARTRRSSSARRSTRPAAGSTR